MTPEQVNKLPSRVFSMKGMGGKEGERWRDGWGEGREKGRLTI